MRYNKDIKPITYLKTSSADLVTEVQESKRPIIITQNGEAKVVVQDLTMYQKQQDLLLLLKTIALAESEIKKHDLVDEDQLFSRIEKKLNPE